MGLSFAQYKAKVGVLNKVVLARKDRQIVASEVCLAQRMEESTSDSVSDRHEAAKYSSTSSNSSSSSEESD